MRGLGNILKKTVCVCKLAYYFVREKFQESTVTYRMGYISIFRLFWLIAWMLGMGMILGWLMACINYREIQSIWWVYSTTPELLIWITGTACFLWLTSNDILVCDELCELDIYKLEYYHEKLDECVLFLQYDIEVIGGDYAYLDERKESEPPAA